MPICPGAAERRPGEPAHIILTPDQVAGVLPVQLQWLVPFLPYIPPIVIDVDSLCDTQPEDVPLLTATDLLPLITKNPWAIAAATAAKIAQLVHTFAWYKLCRCVDVATPAAPAAPAEPADLPVLNPPGITAPVAQICASYREVWPEGPQSYQAEDVNFSKTTIFLRNYWIHVGTGVRGPQPTQPSPAGADSVMLPAGATEFRFTIDNTAQNGTTHDLGFSYALSFVKSDGTHALPHPPINIVSGAVRSTITGPIPAGAVAFWGVGGSDLNGAMNDTIAFEVDIACGGTFNQPVAACCPPDPTLVGLIEQLMGSVTLLQRQLAPFAYVPDGEVAGLSGNGEIAVQGLVAVSVLLTTLPAHYGMAEGSPDALFDVGYISLGTVDGFERSRPIATSPFYVRVGSEVTRVGYSLSPGVVATVRKHAREP